MILIWQHIVVNDNNGHYETLKHTTAWQYFYITFDTKMVNAKFFAEF